MVCMYACMYGIYAVKLKSGPIFALFKVKKWSIFLFFGGFYFSQIPFSLQKEEDFRKKQKKKKQQQKNTIFKVKKWSNYVAQHNWTTF